MFETIPGKATFKPLSRGRCKCNQTGKIIKGRRTEAHGNSHWQKTHPRRSMPPLQQTTVTVEPRTRTMNYWSAERGSSVREFETAVGDARSDQHRRHPYQITTTLL